MEDRDYGIQLEEGERCDAIGCVERGVSRSKKVNDQNVIKLNAKKRKSMHAPTQHQTQRHSRQSTTPNTPTCTFATPEGSVVELEGDRGGGGGGDVDGDRDGDEVGDGGELVGIGADDEVGGFTGGEEGVEEATQSFAVQV